MKIRLAKVRDWKKILKLLKETPELQCSGKKVDDEYTRDYVLDSIKNKKENIVLVAEEDKKIIGLLTAELFKKKRYSYLTDFAVVKERRPEGVGRKIYDKFLELLKKDKVDTLAGITKIKDRAMHKFLKKEGVRLGEKVYFFEKKLFNR
jgi:ribosomal protein S18 acetylase RimI-like enzyme